MPESTIDIYRTRSRGFPANEFAAMRRLLAVDASAATLTGTKQHIDPREGRSQNESTHDHKEASPGVASQ
jgi:hypothetical protein